MRIQPLPPDFIKGESKVIDKEEVYQIIKSYLINEYIEKYYRQEPSKDTMLSRLGERGIKTNPYNDLDFDSLDMVELFMFVEKELNVRLNDDEVCNCPTIEKVCDLVMKELSE